MGEIREKLINAYLQGDLLKILCEANLNNIDNRKFIGKEIAILHNEGEIDAIAEFRQFLLNLKGRELRLIRDIFKEALPEINASVASVMDCIKHLATESSNDLARRSLFEPFIKYCEADSRRPEEVLHIVESNNDKMLDFIVPAIIAGSNSELSKYIAIVIALTHHVKQGVRVRAVDALGRINYCNSIPLVADALCALDCVIQSEQDDYLLGTGIKSAFSLYLADKNIENDVANLINVALYHKGELSLHAASEVLAFNTEKISDVLFDIMLDALKFTKSQNKDTLENIGFGLLHLVKTNQEEKAFSFLESLLIQNDGDLSILAVESLIHYMYFDNRQILNELATRWFISKNILLCSAIMDIVGLGYEDDIVLLANTHQIEGQPEGPYLFAARKAIGWLFTNPVSCVSFIVSLIDASSKDEAEQITDLLFDPLLISYPGKVKQYLESILLCQSPKVQSVLNTSLAKLESYHVDLKAAWNIPDLLPSQAQRETHLRLMNRQFTDSFNEAQKSSIVNLICSKSVLLYGRKSINYVHYPNAQIQRMEVPLHSFGHSIEYPSLNNIDPHGLEYMLRVFRAEGCK
ncbi:hypothetical protein E4K67_11925 [Desulfosporosinus fructosivorans]|uniref:Uncharacterized protein n=1 Tax=Desulfosporosinus fructosivorans TaxID=2018669 RepID=A0A4Z0R9A4_9FIRM|nr:hypothetical protein [Desulfosporosinus fructosivorans]TGE38617.1 hypothetical protein E4K67_11925 [Desulfosporosinus fructosivorans]